MFVGETGVERIARRAAELMKEDPNEDVRARGGIDLATIQKYVNLWYSLSLDLFGGENSSNAANYFASGLKGRYKEGNLDDHSALDGVYPMDVPKEGRVSTEEVPLRNAMNEVLRDAYTEDCQRGVDRWNRSLGQQDCSFRLRLPSKRFHRQIGLYSNHDFTPDGDLVTADEWQRRRDEWLPSASDIAYIAELQKPVREPGKLAPWLAQPLKGINGQPFDFEYVKRAV